MIRKIGCLLPTATRCRAYRSIEPWIREIDYRCRDKTMPRYGALVFLICPPQYIIDEVCRQSTHYRKIIHSSFPSLCKMPLRNIFIALQGRAVRILSRTPGLRKLPPSAIAIIVLLMLINIVVWAAVGVILVEFHLFHEKVEADNPSRISMRKVDLNIFCLWRSVG
jgi:hypothetical protein